MRSYRIWKQDSMFTDIKAEGMEMTVVDNKPVKIRFYDNDEIIIAEFYCDSICGWAQLDHVVDP